MIGPNGLVPFSPDPLDVAVHERLQPRGGVARNETHMSSVKARIECG